jgi:acetyltransferase-like isoleucine patch superfamily enzyme
LLNFFLKILGRVFKTFKRKRLLAERGLRIAKSAEIVLTSTLCCERSGQIEIGENSLINDLCSITAYGCNIRIGNGVLVGPGTIMHTSSHRFDKTEIPIWKQGSIVRPIVIEDDVWIGANCTVLGGVKIGAHSVIGANSLVNRDIPQYSVAFGVPCKVKRNRHDPKQTGSIP